MSLSRRYDGVTAAMIRLTRLALVFATLVLLHATGARAAEQVDLLLVLASDVSRSVDHPKFLLQREGYTAAVADPQVMEAIKSGPLGKIAISFVEWSGFGAQKVVIDWTKIDGPAPARSSATSLPKCRARLPTGPRSAAASNSAVRSSRSSPFEAPRHTIDVSGDGTNNAGRDVRLARDEALAKGVVINGLVILSDRPVPWNAEHTNPPGGLEKYYRDNVIGGPGAFVLVAENFKSFRPRHHQEDDRGDRNAQAGPARPGAVTTANLGQKAAC